MPEDFIHNLHQGLLGINPDSPGGKIFLCGVQTEDEFAFSRVLAPSHHQHDGVCGSFPGIKQRYPHRSRL
jgi:hypothetical protein